MSGERGTLRWWARDPAPESGEDGRARVQLQRCDGAALQSWQLEDGWVEGGVQETLSLSLTLTLTLTLTPTLTLTLTLTLALTLTLGAHRDEPVLRRTLGAERTSACGQRRLELEHCRAISPIPPHLSLYLPAPQVSVGSSLDIGEFENLAHYDRLAQATPSPNPSLRRDPDPMGRC